MIIVGVVLLVLAYALPIAGVPIPPGIDGLLNTFGWIALIVGIVLLLLGHFRGGPVVGSRRYWY